MGCIVLLAFLAGLYHIGWIVSLDRILLAGLDRNILYRIGWIRKHRLLYTSWLLHGWYGWDGWTVWGVVGARVRRTDVSTRRNGSANMGAGTGAPPLALEWWRRAR